MGSPLFIFLLVKLSKPIWGYVTLVISIIIPTAISFGLAYGLGFLVYFTTLEPYPGDADKSAQARLGGELTYFRPYCRFAPYGVGLITGYLLHKGGGKVQMKKATATLGWIVAFILAIIVVYGQSYYRYTETPMPLAFSASYVALERLLWAVAVAWVIVACLSGYGGYVNDFLSWSAWAPLSRMTYSAYLFHPAIMFFYGAHLKTRFYIDNMTTIYLVVGHLFLTMLITLGVVISIESPFLALEKILFPCFFKTSTKKPQSAEPAGNVTPNGYPGSRVDGADNPRFHSDQNGVPPAVIAEATAQNSEAQGHVIVDVQNNNDFMRKRVSDNSFISEL